MDTNNCKITLDTGTVLTVAKGENLLDVLRRANVAPQAPCGGIGRCGKCLVSVGGRDVLACKTYVTHDMTVTAANLDFDSEKAFILTDYTDANSTPPAASSAQTEAQSAPATTSPEQPGAQNAPIAASPTQAGGQNASTLSPSSAGSGIRQIRSSKTPTFAHIAIDLGTTTVVAKLISTHGIELDSAAFLNAQRTWGADVISRIDAAMEDASALSEIIRNQIDGAIRNMLSKADIAPHHVISLTLAGNTSMIYLLLGQRCRSLGAAPFQPEFPFKDIYTYTEVFGHETLPCPCHLMPWLSAFVGGDVIAGLAGLMGLEGLKNALYDASLLLIDMGTNGEMAFLKDDRLIATSTAAGPAFEGVGISCGMGGAEGAIARVRMAANGPAEFETIGNGLLDIMAWLLASGQMDATGLLTGDPSGGRIYLSGNVFISQKDIREFQLAKGAIRAGIEILMDEMGAVPDRVCLAGGFGQRLDPASAAAIGLIPPALLPRVEAVGNSSLAGAVKACLDPRYLACAQELVRAGQEINLAMHPLFNDLFMRSMEF